MLLLRGLDRITASVIMFVPKTLDDLIGNKISIDYVSNFLKNIQSNDKLLIIGPSGVGKTICIEMLAKEYNYELIKIDSMNCENSKDFLDRLHKLHQWKDISSYQEDNITKKRILLIDELETLIKIDRNIPSYLIKYWNQIETHLPCILVGQYDAEKKIGDLKKLCTMVHFYRIQETDLFLYFKKRIPKNKIKLVDLMTMVESSNGSIYATIQMVTQKLKKKSNASCNVDCQDKALIIEDIFKYDSYEDIYNTLMDDPWIHPLKILENAPKLYPDYEHFLKDYLVFEEWIYHEKIYNEYPIGYLSEVILINNQQIPESKKRSIQMDFTKLLSYMSTQKKLHRLLYEKIPHQFSISDIGYYWVHQMKTK